MRKRPFLGTQSRVTELALGTWGLSGDGYGPVPEAEQDRVIDRALAMGIRLFDTADCYGGGSMEARLGRRLPRGGGAVVVTKLGTRLDTQPARKDFSGAYLREAFERSRERLGRDVVDCVLLHNPSAQTFQEPSGVQALVELREKRWITAWGASVGTVEAGRAAIYAGAQVLELPYNVFHTREFRELFHEIYVRGISVLARSVLSHGLLAGQWPTNKDFPEGDHRAERWTQDELRRRIMQLNALRPVLSEEIPTLRSVALRYALSNDGISSVVLGPRSALQLDQLVREAGRSPPYLDSEKLSALSDRLQTVGAEP